MLKRRAANQIVTLTWESPWFTYVQVFATYHGKAFDEGYNFTLDLTSIEGLHKKLWASKVMGDPILGQNDIWV
jgi:hypothetical protein